MSKQSNTSQAAISLPKGGGAIQGIGESFQVNAFSGTANHTVPIALSPGRNGFGPSLALEYSSGHGNGLFGLGWQLALPHITRKTDKGLPQYGAQDVFVLSGAEDLVPVLKSVLQPDTGKTEWIPDPPLERDGHLIHFYRPRTEGLFARIERWVEQASGEIHWRTITRDNVTSVFGKTRMGRVFDPRNPARVHEWLLEETWDGYGNHSRVEYAADDPALYAAPTNGGGLPDVFERRRMPAQRYPRRIHYGNFPEVMVDANGNPLTYPDGQPVGPLRNGRRYAFEVVFDYGDWDPTADLPNPQRPPEDQAELFGRPGGGSGRPVPLRPDRFSSSRAGFEIRTLRRCERVLMIHHFAELGGPTLVRSTDFTYRVDPDTRLSLLTEVTVTGHERQVDHSYRSISLPPLAFDYSGFSPGAQRLQPITVAGGPLPGASLGDPGMAVVDLHGDGLPGLLQTGPGGFRFWRNLGQGVLERPRTLDQMPAGLSLDQPEVGFADLAGNGLPDLLVHSGALPGFHETTPEGAWKRFTPFARQPGFLPGDPHVRMLDLTGDGRSDALMTTDSQFLWFECLGAEGFGAARAVARIHDLDQFPDLDFNDPAGRVRLADMSGDGLNDIVLIHDGRIDYWPNLGYGRFGKRVSMAMAPQFDADFDPRRLMLADLNGTGCADLVYVDSRRVQFWFNQSGNAWSPRQTILGTPRVDDSSAVEFADLLGTGTATLVWSGNPGDTEGSHYKALDFCGGVKPYVLQGTDNHRGITTRLRYAPSTRFFLEDRARGRPWLTPLPFPVQVLQKVETIDHISGNKHVSTYRYHHGYYDGRERAFMGFGRVDQFDSETFADFARPDLHGDDSPFGNASPAHHMPPVETRTWYHTGVYFDSLGARRLDYRDLAQRFRQEFYALDTLAPPLPPHMVETGDAPAEAYRALRGAPLRSEIYAHDGSERAAHPYQVSETRHRVKQRQPRGGNAHAVFLVDQAEGLSYSYERDPADPRITHTLSLALDAYGNPLRTLSVGYGRRQPDDDLPSPADREQQTKTHITYSEIRYTNAIDDPLTHPDSHRLPLPCETRDFELTGFAPASGGPRFSLEEWVENDFARLDNTPTLPYEGVADGQEPRKRLVEHGRSYFRRDDLGGLLPLGGLAPLALPGETRKLAFTSGLLARIHAGRVTPAQLASHGYLSDNPDHGYWIPSGRVHYSPGPADTPEQELAFARQHFFMVHRNLDPFGTTGTIRHDPYVLHVVETADSLGNRIVAAHDYRVLQPRRVTDPNGNRSEAAYDTLGLVAGSAVMGKVGESAGDSLDGFSANLTEAQITAFLTDPLAHAPALLGRASSRFLYDLHRYRREAQPGFTAVIARERHAAETPPGEATAVQLSLSYSDGAGRVIQSKTPAEPGPLTPEEPPLAVRWVATGWTVFNNKGKPVRQYEPFFDDSPVYLPGKRVGTSSVLFYDPLGRVVASLQPDHTWSKSLFSPWRKEEWDVNDTVLISDPRTDPDVGAYFDRLESALFLPSWYDARKDGALGEHERAAARKAAAHAATPSRLYADALGRPFLTRAQNRHERQGRMVEETLVGRILMDIEGNKREERDALDRVVARYDYDMLGNTLRVSSMESGERWLLKDVAGRAVRAWDGRGNVFRNTYDPLGRPLESWLAGADGKEKLIGLQVYGESLPNPELRNLRGTLARLHDQAGIVENEAFDFKGNLLSSRRQLAVDYKTVLNWKGRPRLLTKTYASSHRYDALNRPVSVTTPDGSVLKPRFNRAGLLQSLAVQLRGAATETRFVEAVDYDAKGRRTRIAYGNGVASLYRHDPLTQRMSRHQTLRGTTPLQDLGYHYDPVGNLTHIEDQAQQTLFFANQVVAPSSDYTYDALYRLLRAEGREHAGQAERPETSWDDAFRVRLPQPTDGTAMRRYAEEYRYDLAGNLLQLIHTAGTSGWTRNYLYQETSQLEAGRKNNRLSGSAIGDRAAETYPHDAHGSMTAMPHLAAMAWDFADRLRRVDLTGGGVAYYVYDASGQRIRKVVERNGGALIEERISLGAFEVFRRRNAAGTVSVERESLHIMDDSRRIALVETRTVGTDGQTVLSRARKAPAGPPVPLIRYQHGNHLGSAALELDQAGQIISYEEYYPHGSTAYQAGRSASEVSLKRYRYSAMERDEETGFNHHGVRYYAPWLGRWTSADPQGVGGDGSNLYAYAANNPTGRVDTSGFESQKADKGAHQWAGSAAENDARHERLNWLASELHLHGRTKGDITTFLKHFGDDKVLKEYGYSEPGFFTRRSTFQQRTRNAILKYLYEWDQNHDKGGSSMGPVSAGQDAEIKRVEFIKAWEEGLAYVTMSVVAGGFAEAARLFTDDPKKITAAAGLGLAASGVAGAGASAKGNKGSYTPDAVKSRVLSGRSPRAIAAEARHAEQVAAHKARMATVKASVDADRASAKNRNPAGGTNNCQLCTKALSAVWNGQTDAVAGIGPVAPPSAVARDYPGYMRVPGNTLNDRLRNIVNMMRAVGPGNHAVIWGTWINANGVSTGVGHILNVKNSAGVVLFLDAQTGLPAVLESNGITLGNMHFAWAPP